MTIKEAIDKVKLLIDKRLEVLISIKKLMKEKGGFENNAYYYEANHTTLTRKTKEEIDNFESLHRIKFPEFIRVFLIHIGSGELSGMRLLDQQGQFFPLQVALDKDFAMNCIQAGLSPLVLEEVILDDFDNLQNKFSNEIVQKEYEEIGSERDKVLTLVYRTNWDSSIVLNKFPNDRLVLYDIEGVSNDTIYFNGEEYNNPNCKYFSKTKIREELLSTLTCSLERTKEAHHKLMD